MSIGNFLKSLSKAILAGMMLVGKSGVPSRGGRVDAEAGLVEVQAGVDEPEGAHHLGTAN